MNTVRVPTSFDAEPGPVATYVRMIVAATLLSVAVFAGFYVLGRSERPAGTPREQLASSVSTASAGPAIPIRLASSPPVAATETAAFSRPAHARTTIAPTTSVVAQPSLASAAPSTTSAAAATPSAPVPAPVTPSPAPVVAAPVTTRPAPAQTPPAPAPRISGGSGGGAKSQSGGSTSFDSSG
jgi:hypothetical protein